MDVDGMPMPGAGTTKPDALPGGAIFAKIEAGIPARRKAVDSATTRVLDASAEAQEAIRNRAAASSDFATRIRETKPPEPKDYLADLPALEKPPSYQPQNPLEAFGSIGTALAMFGAGLTRRPFVTSLRAGAAAMRAFHENDVEGFKLNLEAWKANSEHTSKLMGWRLDQYRLASDKYKNDLSSLQAEYGAIAKATDDKVMVHALQTGDFGVVEKVYKDELNALDKAEDNRREILKLLETQRYHDILAGRLSDREKKIKELTDRGFSTEDAADLAAGRLRLGKDENNNLLLVNVADPSKTKIITLPSVEPSKPGTSTSSSAQPMPAAPANASPAPASATGAPRTFGVVPWLAEVASKTAGQAFDWATFPEVTKAREDMRFLREAIVDAYTKSERKAVAEQNRILQLVPSLGPMESPARARDMLGQLSLQLKKQEADDLAYSQRRDVTTKERVQSRQRAEAMRRALDMLGSEQQAKLNVTGNSPSAAGVPAGVDSGVWEFMTPEEKALFAK